MDPAILDYEPITLARALGVITKSSAEGSAEHAEGLAELTAALAGDPSAGAALERRLASEEDRAKWSGFVLTWQPPHVELFPIAARLVLALQAGTADVETTAAARREAFEVLVSSYRRRSSSPELARLEAVAVLEHAVATATEADTRASSVDDAPKGAA